LISYQLTLIWNRPSHMKFRKLILSRHVISYVFNREKMMMMMFNRTNFTYFIVRYFAYHVSMN